MSKIIYVFLVIASLCNPFSAFSAEVTNNHDNAFYIKSIKLENRKVLSKQLWNKLIKNYLNTHLNANKVSNLISDIKLAYFNKGYITTLINANLNQNLSDGELVLNIQNGIVEYIKMNSGSTRTKMQVFFAFPRLPYSNILHLPTLEQGIDQLNSVSSNNASLKILPGDSEGGSIIQIDNIVINPFRVDIGTDNLGDGKKLKKLRYKANISIDNIFSINDNIYINYIHHPQHSNNKYIPNHSWGLGLSFPYSYYYFQISHNHNKNNQLAGIDTDKNSNVIFMSASNITKVGVKMLVFKRKHYKMFLDGDIEWGSSNSFIKDNIVDILSQKFGIAHINWLHTGILINGIYNLSLTFHKGLPWFKNESNKTDENQADNKFQKFEINTNWNKSYKFSTLSIGTTTNLYGQYSASKLPVNNQLVNRGNTSNNGLILKQEFNISQMFKSIKILSPIQFFVEFDFGYLYKPHINDFKGQVVTSNNCLSTGYNTGVRYASKYVNLNLSYSSIITSLSNNKSKHNSFYFNLSLKLHSLFNRNNK